MAQLLLERRRMPTPRAERAASQKNAVGAEDGADEIVHPPSSPLSLLPELLPPEPVALPPVPELLPPLALLPAL
ncbi:MAG TPA: hypothetical protein PKA88_22385, partial [Polyangiaceae bacterium]|nr:hypothetical protein [Polyangiaceae bacterium]